MMDQFQDKNKRKGLVGTILFHLALLIIFLFYGLTIPVPMPEEEGLPIELDLGNTDFGSGDEQPESTAEPEVTEPISEPVEATPAESIEEVATQEELSDMSIPKEERVEKPVEKEPELDPRLQKIVNSNPFQTKKDNNSQGQGSTDQAGDHGKPDGSPTGDALQGDKTGGGISYSLGGRGFKGAPPITGNMQESGKIVVDIIVDRQGNVIRVTPGGRGSTITNGDLVRKAVEAARKAKFTPKADAPEEQKGTLTFEFILE